jgi:cytochrome P450
MAVNTAPITGLAAAREYLSLLRDPVASMRSLYQRGGPLVVLGPVALGEPVNLHVLAVGPEFNRQVLGDPTRFRPTGLFLRGPKNSAQRRVRFGLTRMTGEQHRQQRQLVAPPFHRTAVQTYHGLMSGLTNQMLERWRTGERYDIYAEMRELTLQIASAVLFSHNPDEALPIGRLIDQWLRLSFAGPVWLFPVNVPGTPYYRLLRLAEQIEDKILAMIAKRRGSSEKHDDVLSILMEARDEENRGMTDTELVGQTAILFMASFETTASALTWTLFLIAQHPAVMRDLIDELDGVLGGNPPDAEQLARLPFLNNVIKESMRVLPPVPYTVRATTKYLNMGPHRVPTGARILCSHYLTHHLPDLYPEPERFRPERWNEIDPNQYEYMPFSAGPRMCIGAMFATQLLKISLATMLQRFRFTVVPETRIDRTVRITMQPRQGLPMMIFKNDRKFAASPVVGQIREMVTLP